MIDVRVILPHEDKQDFIKLRVVWHDSSKGRGDQIHSIEEKFPLDMPIGQCVEIATLTAGRNFGSLIIDGKAG